MPSGADRLISDANGIDAVIVNGNIIRENGIEIGNSVGLPGRLLRAGHAA